MIRVRLSEPSLATDLHDFLRAMLAADVRERANQLEVEFAEPLDASVQRQRVEKVASAWRAQGHLDVRTEVLVLDEA